MSDTNKNRNEKEIVAFLVIISVICAALVASISLLDSTVDTTLDAILTWSISFAMALFGIAMVFNIVAIPAIFRAGKKKTD